MSEELDSRTENRLLPVSRINANGFLLHAILNYQSHTLYLTIILPIREVGLTASADSEIDSIEINYSLVVQSVNDRALPEVSQQSPIVSILSDTDVSEVDTITSLFNSISTLQTDRVHLEVSPQSSVVSPQSPVVSPQSPVVSISSSLDYMKNSAIDADTSHVQAEVLPQSPLTSTIRYASRNNQNLSAIDITLSDSLSTLQTGRVYTEIPPQSPVIISPNTSPDRFNLTAFDTTTNRVHPEVSSQSPIISPNAIMDYSDLPEIDTTTSRVYSELSPQLPVVSTNTLTNYAALAANDTVLPANDTNRRLWISLKTMRAAYRTASGNALNGNESVEYPLSSLDPNSLDNVEVCLTYSNSSTSESSSVIDSGLADSVSSFTSNFRSSAN